VKAFLSFMILLLLITGIILTTMLLILHSSPAEGAWLATIAYLILGTIFTVPNLFPQTHHPDCYFDLQEDWQ